MAPWVVGTFDGSTERRSCSLWGTNMGRDGSVELGSDVGRKKEEKWILDGEILSMCGDFGASDSVVTLWYY